MEVSHLIMLGEMICIGVTLKIDNTKMTEDQSKRSDSVKGKITFWS